MEATGCPPGEGYLDEEWCLRCREEESVEAGCGDARVADDELGCAGGLDEASVDEEGSSIGDDSRVATGVLAGDSSRSGR